MATANDGCWTDAGCRLLRLADVKPERNRWLWEGRIPLGMLTVLEGDPKTGKSMLTTDIAARVTTGRSMPGEVAAVEPANALFVSTEDHPAMTLRPRFEAAGADLARVFFVMGMKSDDGGDMPPTLTSKGLERLEQQVVESQARLVVIDPLMNYLPSDVDSHRDQDIRRVLRELAAMARRTRSAVVLVRHLTKAFGGSALYRGAGSIGIAGAARSVLTTRRDGKWHKLESTASNIAHDVPTLYYSLVAAADSARVDWTTQQPAREKRALKQTRDDERRLLALEYARDHSASSATLLAPVIGKSPATAGRLLNTLRSEQLLGTDGRPTAAGLERLASAGR